MDVEQTLEERGARYGLFRNHAKYIGKLLEVYESSPQWETLRYDSAQALRVIADKIARILNGDPEYDDNWRDIAGYATLVLDRITEEAESNSKSSSQSLPTQPADWQYEEEG